MTYSAKKKKQAINYELRLGSCTIFLMLPIIAFGIFGAMMGAVSLLTSQEITATIAIGVILFMTSAFFSIVYGMIIWHNARHIWRLFRRKQDLKAEQKRIAHLIDTSSAENRLKDYDLESGTYFYDEPINKKEQADY
jgi:hypothetical protein